MILIFLSFALSLIFSKNDSKPYYILQRPTVYSGLQTTDKDPIFFGLIFNDHDDERGGFVKLREIVSYDDRLDYKVVRSNPTKFSHIEMKDSLRTDLKMTAKWIKLDDKSFAYQVTGEIEEDDEKCEGKLESKISVYMYLSSTNKETELQFNKEKGEIIGSTSEFGKFKLSSIEERSGAPLYHFGNYSATPFFGSDAIKTILRNGIKSNDDPENPACCYPLNHDRLLPNTIVNQKSNIIVIQKVLKTPFQWTIKFENTDQPQKGFDFEEKFKEYSKEFDEIFESKFPVLNFLKDSRISHTQNQDWVEFGKRALSSLLNGLSFFQGDAWVYDPKTKKKWKVSNRKLLSTFPSKIGFPRAFYWDEGFHQMVISRFSPELHEEITRYWYELQDENGWIAREQIIGEELMYTADEWAWYGHLDQMNPPSFFLASERYIAQNQSTSTFLKEMYPLFKKTYYWYLNNLKSNEDYTYHWNGRIEAGDSALDSGLDDYPRFFKFEESEKNIDLQAWIAKTSLIMKNFANELGDTEGEKEFGINHQNVMEKLQSLFWNDDIKFYSDINAKEKSEHLGVNGLLPFCLGLEDRDDKINRFIEVLKDELFSPYGITSLSKYDKRFIGNYWRGNIWINQNYICLKSLKNLEKKGYEVKDLRKAFQFSIASNIYENYYRKRGTFFETFHPITGKGYNHRMFMGWTSLVLLIMSEDYV